MKRTVDRDEEEESKKDYYSIKESDEEKPGHFQRYLVLDTSRATTPTSADNSKQTSQNWSSMCYFRITMM